MYLISKLKTRNIYRTKKLAEHSKYYTSLAQCECCDSLYPLLSSRDPQHCPKCVVLMYQTSKINTSELARRMGIYEVGIISMGLVN